MEMDLTSMMVVAEGVARDGSYSALAWRAHRHRHAAAAAVRQRGAEGKYLPKLAKCEMIAAYCLSEPQAGSDALAARTRADLTPDGKHYVLNGQKMWITNGGYADLYTVFAKVGGEKFTAFLVERAWPGVSPGKEEQKMGIKGSSTTAVYLDNVKVPVENVLGEIGRGHIIAFNILNLGRLKLGPFAHGGCRDDLAVSIRYAKERKAFGKSISEFGMIHHKMAEMAIRTYASESMTLSRGGRYRGAAGRIFVGPVRTPGNKMLKAVEEFATECSFVKVFASETLDYVVDEGVQIHGGYGFHQDYSVEHAYRDSRINRIFEGTNEINRLLATGMMLKRAQKGTLPLVEAVKKLQSEILSGPSLGRRHRHGGQREEERRCWRWASAYQKFGANDRRAAGSGGRHHRYPDERLRDGIGHAAGARRSRTVDKSAENAKEMTAVFSREAMDAIESAARTVLAACSEGDALRTNLAVLKRFTKYEPVDAIGAAAEDRGAADPGGALRR